MTRSVHDLAAASSRDIHRLVTASMHGGSSLYALDEDGARGGRARPDPDPGAVPRLRGQLPRGQRGRPGDRRRHHGRVARADLDRGDPQHDHHGRRDDRGRGRRDRPRRDRCASGSATSRRRSQARRDAGRPAAARRRARVARPAVRGRPLGPGADPPGRRLGPPRRGRRALGPDDLGRGRRGRPGDAPADAVRLPPRRRPSTSGRATPRPPGYDGARRRSGAARSSRSTARPTSAGPGPRVIDGIELLAEIFDPDAFVDIAPLGSWTPVDGRRRRGRVPFRATLRLPVVRRRHTPPRARRPRGLGAALPGLRRQGRRQRVPAVPAAPGADRARSGRPAAAAARRRPRPPTPAAPDADRRDAAPTRRPRRRDGRLLRGPRARVRRLVPAPRPLRPRPDPRRRLERRARRRRPLARRACRSHGEIVELAAGHRLVVAAPRRRRASCRSTTRAPAPLDRARERLVAHGLRAHLHVRDAWAEPDRPVDAVFTGLLAEPRPARPARRRSSRSSGAGSSRAARSPSSTRCRIRSRARPTTRRRPTTRPSAGSTTAASSRSSRSTTSRPSSRPRFARAGFATAEVTTTGRFFLLGGATAERSAPDASPAGDPRRLYSGPMSPLAKSHDRDRRLRRHGRGDDRRPAPRRARRARPGRRQPSAARAARAPRARVRHPDGRRATSRRSRAPTSSCSGSSPRCSAGSGARSARTCAAASSS